MKFQFRVLEQKLIYRRKTIFQCINFLFHLHCFPSGYLGKIDKWVRSLTG